VIIIDVIGYIIGSIFTIYLVCAVMSVIVVAPVALLGLITGILNQEGSNHASGIERAGDRGWRVGKRRDRLQRWPTGAHHHAARRVGW
jgi:hypothetical protein